MGWREKANRAKRLHRPTLKSWERDGLHSTFPNYASSILSQEPYSKFAIHGSSIICERWKDCDSNEGRIPAVLEASETPPELFHKEYEAKCIPVVIRGVPNGVQWDSQDDDRMEEDNQFSEEKKDDDGHLTQQDVNTMQHRNKPIFTHHRSSPPWPALQSWSFPQLYHSSLRSRLFKVGEDDDGYTVKMKLRHFLRYLEQNSDDSPLYIFDATFDEDRVSKSILLDYTVPPYFEEDLFRLVGERRRPPYRWFLVGPERSGTTVHIDPLGTSAWNTLMFGVKRWVLFPPHISKSVVKGRRFVLRGEDDEAIHYFTTILPRVKRHVAGLVESGEVEGSGYENFVCYEFTQYAGETVFIPHGWWHAVLNITHTVGITQNYCSRRNFDAVWLQTRSGRKKMSCTWLRRLKDQYPDLARRAQELNRRDGFVMWEDDPVEQRRWMRKKAEKERKRREKEAKKRLSRGKCDDSGSDSDRSEEKRHAKKEKWGEHRTSERRKEETLIDCSGDVCGSRVVSPH